MLKAGESTKQSPLNLRENTEMDSKTKKKKKGLISKNSSTKFTIVSLLQWNCQGMFSKWEELKHIISTYNPVCYVRKILIKENMHLSCTGERSYTHCGNFDTSPHG